MDGASVNTASSEDARAAASVGSGNAGDFKLGMFGGSELLGGTFGASLVNGIGSMYDGSALVTPGDASTAFDLSDFPSLGGGAPGSAAPVAGGATPALSNSGAFRQQQLLAHRQMQMQSSSMSVVKSSSPSAFSAQNGNANNSSGGGGGADGGWPALPGANGNGNVGGATSSSNIGNSPFLRSAGEEKVSNLSGTSSNSTEGASFYSANEVGVPPAGGGIHHLDGSSLLGAGNGALSVLQQQQRRESAATSGSASSGNTPVAAAGSALRGDYGLLGLLQLIRMPDCDRKALALGTELSLFAPFTDANSESKEPNYQLPMCYYMQPPALKTGHLTKFQLETLFYIFYGLPKDVLQAYSAQELYSREWRYHADLELWFKEVGPSDGIAQAQSPNGAQQYMYFDINSWERRLCNANMMNKNVTSGFLSEEDVRVKFPNS